MNTTEKLPQHVDNLNTIEALEGGGFDGPDASLQESLSEYGIAWRDLGEETLFVYSVGRGHFDRATFPNNLDVRKEFEWVEWDAFHSFIGSPREEWDEFPLTDKIHNLLCFYGWENVFGSTYWPGFQIAGLD